MYYNGFFFTKNLSQALSGKDLKIALFRGRYKKMSVADCLPLGEGGVEDLECEKHWECQSFRALAYQTARG